MGHIVAPCSMLSRTLRAGVAGAEDILDSICARRSGDRQVGTKEWSPGRTKEWVHPFAEFFVLLWSAS